MIALILSNASLVFGSILPFLAVGILFVIPALHRSAPTNIPTPQLAMKLARNAAAKAMLSGDASDPFLIIMQKYCDLRWPNGQFRDEREIRVAAKQARKFAKLLKSRLI